MCVCVPGRVTGSVATIKLAVLCRLLLEFAEVKVAATTSSRHFVNEAELPEQVKPLLGVSAGDGLWCSACTTS